MYTAVEGMNKLKCCKLYWITCERKNPIDFTRPATQEWTQPKGLFTSKQNKTVYIKHLTWIIVTSRCHYNGLNIHRSQFE